MTGEALAAPPEHPKREGITDLSDSISRNLREELTRYMESHAFPKSKREMQRITIRFVQRYMERQRAAIRETANRLIAEAERTFYEMTAPQRAAYQRYIAEAKANYNAAVEAAGVDFQAATRADRESRDSLVQSIRDDLSKRMAEADRITRTLIRSAKEGVARIADEIRESGDAKP